MATSIVGQNAAEDMGDVQDLVPFCAGGCFLSNLFCDYPACLGSESELTICCSHSKNVCCKENASPHSYWTCCSLDTELVLWTTCCVVSIRLFVSLTIKSCSQCI